MDARKTAAAHGGHGWLACILPVGARRMRVADPALAETLRYAGATLVEAAPEVEIASPRKVRGDAELTAVAVGEDRPAGGARLTRGANRLARSVRLRVRALLARRALRRRGYPHVFSVLWNVDGALPVLHGPDTRGTRLPLRAVVVGRRSEAKRSTILEAAADASGARPVDQPLVRQGVVVLLGEAGVLRVSLGPAGRQSEEQWTSLAYLKSMEPPAIVADRAPWPIAEGSVGLGRWTLEQRLSGTPPIRLTEALWADCLDFLVALHQVASPAASQDLRTRAEVVAGTCDAAQGHAVRDLGGRLDEELADLPRGFAHGDFWRENLLVEGDRLTGVVDWDYSGGGRLPLLDLYHLWVNEERVRPRLAVGRSVVEQLLPAARSGGDALVRSCCARIGLDPEASLLVDLALAYWLDWVARELELFTDRMTRRLWIRENVQVVLHELSGTMA
jgi:hypothetical protein